MRDAYVLLVTGGFDLPPSAFRAETGDIARQAQSWTLLGEERRGVFRRAGHVKTADLVGAAREVSQGDELDGSRGCHDVW